MSRSRTGKATLLWGGRSVGTFVRHGYRTAPAAKARTVIEADDAPSLWALRD